MDWIAKDYFGRSGGSLILWKKYFIQPIFSFKGEGFVDINFNYKGMHIYLVNVNSSCLILKKRRFWRKLVELKSSWPVGEWCVVGDFNTIKKDMERNRTTGLFNRGEAFEFNSFIGEMNIINIPTIVSKFTWHKPNGGAISRLDSFLVLKSILVA